MVNIFLQFAATETAEKSGLAVLGINPVSLLLQLATFLLLYVLLRKFAFKAIVKMLEQRRKTINDGIRLGQKMEAEHAKLEEDINKALHKARAEADKIVAGAHSEASEIVKQAEEAAKQASTSILDEARAQIKADTDKVRAELRGEISELVADAATVIIGEKIDARKDATLLSRALEEAER